MRSAESSVLFLNICLLALVNSFPFEDGKYRPEKYNIFDDGKYYRPLDEGKYVPGDEGRYIYVYRHGLYPTDTGDYRYIHQVGPNGGNGGQGGNGGDGGEGGVGSGDGTGPDGPGGIHKIDYIGKRIYAEKYPYMHKFIKALIDKYVSTDSMFGNTFESSVNHFNKAFSADEVALKCKYLMPEKANATEFVTQYPPHMELEEGEKLQSFYSFKGTKLLNEDQSISSKHKLKVKYEVYIKVVEDLTDSA